MLFDHWPVIGWLFKCIIQQTIKLVCFKPHIERLICAKHSPIRTRKSSICRRSAANRVRPYGAHSITRNPYSGPFGCHGQSKTSLLCRPWKGRASERARKGACSRPGGPKHYTAGIVEVFERFRVQRQLFVTSTHQRWVD